MGTGVGVIGTTSPEDDGAGSGCVSCTGGGVAGAGFEEVVGNDGGGLQPVCSESQSLERPPQPSVATVSTASESAPARGVRARPDATPRGFVIGMA